METYKAMLELHVKKATVIPNVLMGCNATGVGGVLDSEAGC